MADQCKCNNEASFVELCFDESNADWYPKLVTNYGVMEWDYLPTGTEWVVMKTFCEPYRIKGLFNGFAYAFEANFYDQDGYTPLPNATFVLPEVCVMEC